MSVKIEDIENETINKLSETNSGNELIILPINWDTEKDETYLSTTSTTMKLFRTNNIPAKLLNKRETDIKYLENRSIDWIAPTIFISGEFITNHPFVTGVMSGVLANYIYEIFKGSKKPPNVKLNIIYKKDKNSTAKNITFEGDPSGLTELSKIIDNLNE